jgi:predicted aspartyl protease
MKTIQRSWFVLLTVLLLCSGALAQKSTSIAKLAAQVTVPLLVEGNRPFIDITFIRPNGSNRVARFIIDSGGGGFLITEPLARDLGLHWGPISREEGSELANATETPRAYVGDFPLDLDPSRVIVLVGADNALPKVAPGHADGLLPGHVLAHYLVVFDYPGGKFTLARKNAWQPKGTPLPMPVGRTGYPRTEIEVAGTKYGMLIDTGASFTMVSEVLLKQWGTAHPDWPRYKGAFGEAKTLGGATLETMTIPAGLWGPNKLSEFGVTSQREGTFEKYMSGMMAAPIVGSLAGNVLKRFRLVLDYPNAKLYISGP